MRTSRPEYVIPALALVGRNNVLNNNHNYSMAPSSASHRLNGFQWNALMSVCGVRRRCLRSEIPLSPYDGTRHPPRKYFTHPNPPVRGKLHSRDNDVKALIYPINFSPQGACCCCCTITNILELFDDGGLAGCRTDDADDRPVVER